MKWNRFRQLAGAMLGIVAFSLFSPETPAQAAAEGSGGSAATAGPRELIRQLGDASSVVRDEAAKKLVAQAAAAKEVLTEALSDPDPEIQSRARLILDRILRAERAETAKIPNAKPSPTAVERELVQQLGDPSFFTRERAAEKLAELGVAAKAALTEALQDPDFEIRWRARRILSRVVTDEFEARLAAFISDVEGRQQHDLPGWQRFRDLVGDGRDARKWFAQMMRSDAGLLSAYEEQWPELPELFAARVAWLQRNFASGRTAANTLPPQAVATLLLIGSDETLKDHSRSLSGLYQLLSHADAKQAIGPEGHAAILRPLLEQWVTTAASSGSMYGMMLALKYDLKETGLKQATKTIEGGTTSTSALHYAIITVGRFGGEEHIRLLTPLLENKTVCHRWSNRALKKEGTIDVQVRDAALVVLLRMNEKDPAQYGFKLLRESPETLYYVYTFGFVNDEEREAAHAKWAAAPKE